MPINHDAASAGPGPPTEASWTSKDALLYAVGVGAGSLTQTAMMGTASGALETLGVAEDVRKQWQANIAAGYAVTYICGYILVLMFVPFVAPRLMGVNLKEEATCRAALRPSRAISSTGNSRRARTAFRPLQA